MRYLLYLIVSKVYLSLTLCCHCFCCYECLCTSFMCCLLLTPIHPYRAKTFLTKAPLSLGLKCPLNRRSLRAFYNSQTSHRLLKLYLCWRLFSLLSSSKTNFAWVKDAELGFIGFNVDKWQPWLDMLWPTYSLCCCP